MLNPRPLLWCAAAFALGCNPHTLRKKDDVPVPAPQAFTAGTGGEAAAPTRWWTALGDPQLDAMVDRLLARNLDLEQAVAVVDQAKAGLAAVEGGWWPRVSAGGNASRSKRLLNLGANAPGGGGPLEITNDTFTASLDVSYELDLWGKVKHGAAAAAADLRGAQLQVQTLAMTLTATLADLWFTLIEQRTLAALIEAQLDTNRAVLELMHVKLENGFGSSVDVLQQESQVAQGEAQLPLVKARIRLLEHQLAVLVRDVPGVDVATAAALPEPPPLPTVPVPGKVLAQRPDVAAAQARLEAADHRIAVAIANRLPSLSLSGSLGLQAFDDLSTFFDGYIWSIAGNLAGVVFDGGRLSAEIDRSKAALRERVAALASVSLTALREVEDALVQEARRREHLARLEAQLALAQRLHEDSQARYLEGVTDYLPVFTALRTVQGLEQGLLAARRQLISDRIQLYRALGGDWRDVLSKIEREPVAHAD
ncbi:MAG: efflux transporter outer membrane subunit [Myxococcales bacterium]|nr:efflux transporter outer membrane subunit [Myxococcales bacterium]MCB9523201.1 efflux transporter outer membrane subunit [Myxococcales bacterium]